MFKKLSVTKALSCIFIITCLGLLVNPPKGIAQDSLKKGETKSKPLTTRPNLEKPTEVAVGMYLTNLARVNQVDETYDIQGYLYVKWKDERLAFQPENPKEVRHPKLENIWQPSLAVVNAPASPKKGHIEVIVQPDGNVTYIEQFTTTISSDFKLRHFPFDSQTVEVHIESLTSGTDEIILVPDNQVNGWSKESYVTLSEWDIQGLKTVAKPVQFPPEQKDYSRFTYVLQIQRHYGFYIGKVIVPLCLIVGLSWTAFWINPKDAFASQLSVGITSMLSTITLNITISSSLPRVAYLMLIDGFIVSSYVFVFLSILLTVAVYVLLKSEKAERAFTIQKKSRILLPTSFSFTNIVLIVLFFLL